ncbi:hypothetical protein BC831DRAFT_437103 [Entophlyctis helioformis]|nr:hypothetical protein BC831DRAFT_437103 [Entophlyctis helioformis]
MLLAVRHGRLDLVKWLAVHRPNTLTHQAVAEAASLGHPDTVRFFLDRGHAVDMHMLECTESWVVLQMLVDSLTDREAEELLGMARSRKNKAVAGRLVAHLNRLALEAPKPTKTFKFKPKKIKRKGVAAARPE